MELVEKISKAFPEGKKLPRRLVELVEYQEVLGDFVVSHLEFTASDLVAWFDGDESAASRFGHFAQEGDGSSYALWFYDGQPSEEAPVVFLGGDGSDCGVIAENFDAFISLLAVGVDELGREVAWSWPDEHIEQDPEVDPQKTERFRDWILDRYGLKAPSDPRSIVHSAKAKHPDLEAEIERWQEEHFG